MNERDLAIVGMSCVLPAARSLGQYWSNLANGVDAIVEVPPDRWKEVANFDFPAGHASRLPMKRGGFLASGLEIDVLKFGVIPNAVRGGGAYQFLMLQLIDDALRDAGIAADSPLRERADVIVGMGGYGNAKLTEFTVGFETLHCVVEMIDRRFPELMAGGRRSEIESYLRSTIPPEETDAVAGAIPNIVTSRAANRLDLRGSAFAVDAACASSLIALEHGMMRLRSGESDVAVVGGLFMTQTPTFWHVFDVLGALSPTGVLRPFDSRSDGLVVGEGGGVVILKRAVDALRDGDRVYALVKGAASASDGKDVGVMAPSSRGQVRSLERAYQNAGIDPETIGYLEAHGTGTVVGDLVETETIKKFFGTSPSPPTKRGMGSVKSMIGHTMPAAGIASIIKVALALSNKVLPPTLHCEQPRPELLDAPFYMVTQTRPWIHDPKKTPRRAGINAFGFGGINCHVVLEEVPQTPSRRRKPQLAPRPIQPGVNRETELMLFAAESKVDLARQLRRLQVILQRAESPCRLSDLSFSLAQQFDLKLPYKLALICADFTEFASSIANCLEKLDRGDADWPARENVYFAADAARPRGKVACVFPGMAFPGLSGNYPDHLMELCLHYPELRAEFDLFEARDRHPDDSVPTSAIFSPPASIPETERKRLKARLSLPNIERDLTEQTAPHERYLAGMGVTLANWMSWILIQKLGVQPDMLAGQSQGEMMAISAAGITDFRRMAPFIWKFLNIDPEFKADECMAFVWMSAEEIEPLLKQHPGAHIAIHASPNAIIIGGNRKSLDAIAEVLRERQILVQVLPYAPIHTPYQSHLREKFLRVLEGEKVTLRKPKIDLYSSISTEKYPHDEEGIRDLMLKNLDHPVLLWQTIHKLYDQGARIFVQAGGGHFASHVVTLLEGSSDLVTAATDIDTRNPITQLNHFAAILFTAGISIDVNALFEHRQVNFVDLDNPQPSTDSAMRVPLRLDWNLLTHENVPQRPRRDAQPDPERNAQVGSAASEVESVAAEIAAEAGDALHGASPTTMPFIGRLASFEAGQSLVMERTLDLSEDRFLVDHLFVHAPGLKPESECLPVLPMTFSMELMAETASLLSPGLGLIGFENIRAMRWIALDDSETLDLRIEAQLRDVDEQTGVRRIDVTVYGSEHPHISSTVLFADAYRNDLDFEIEESPEDGLWPVATEDLYSDRHLFHGPRFQTVARLRTFGNPCYSADMRILPQHDLFRSTAEPMLLTDPCVIDGLGQLVGFWCQAQDWYVFPTGIEKLELYGPRPPAGTVVSARYEVTEFDVELKRTRANIVVEDGEGSLWMRVQGWSDWLFRWPPQYGEWLKNPHKCHVSDELRLPELPEEAVCMFVTKQHLRNGELRRTARILLNSSELQQFDAIENDVARWQFVCARLALKDAARRFITQRTGSHVHPLQLLVEHDADGRPLIEPIVAWPKPKVSVAHSETAAIALAADVDVGIDIEPIERDTYGILHEFASPDEIELLDSMSEYQPDETWPTRLWCAKEAVGKVMGIGLQGRPRDFVALDATASGQILVDHPPSGSRYVVNTVRINQFVVAYTSADALVCEPAPAV